MSPVITYNPVNFGGDRSYMVRAIELSKLCKSELGKPNGHRSPASHFADGRIGLMRRRSAYHNRVFELQSYAFDAERIGAPGGAPNDGDDDCGDDRRARPAHGSIDDAHNARG